MNILGNILLVIGCIVGLAGDVMFLNVVYRRSLAWFFGCLFLPFVDDVFLLMHWRAAWKPCVDIIWLSFTFSHKPKVQAA